MSVTGISANRLELLQIADAVAREKSIDKEIVIEAIEEAIQKAARSRYGAEHDIRVHIDQRSGEMTITRVVTVVADGTVENTYAEQALSDAMKDDKEAQIGKAYTEILPPFEFGRVQTQMARQVVTHKVREAERERQYEEFKDRISEVINGTVKRVEYGNVIVDLAGARALCAATSRFLAKTSRLATASGPIFTTCAARPRARKSCSAARMAASSPSCLRKKCRKSMTA
jgi:N utilization substance protein A